MSKLRSIALCALALIGSAFMMMPASAAVPLDPGFHAVATERVSHPAPAILDVDHVAIAADIHTEASVPRCWVRSPELLQTASVALSIGRKLPTVDIRRRC